MASLPEYPGHREVHTMRVPYPILLLHGLGQKAEVWEGPGSAYYARDLGLSFGGTLYPKGSSLSPPRAGSADADFYVVQFSNPVDSVGAWGTEVETCVNYVCEHTGADRVILIGYSMGGLAARSYLTRKPTSHNVKRLITIGTPHLGSAFARVWTWKNKMQQGAASSNPLISVPARAALSALQGAEGDVPFDAPAVRDLRRPEDGGEFLRSLGKRTHPLDVEYVSVIGSLDMFSEAKKLSEGLVQEILRRLLSLDNGLPEVFAPGDGVVSTSSQDIMNIEFFKNDAPRRRAARSISVPTVHVDHLRRSVDVQRVTLDEKPEFRGAELYQKNGVPVVAIDVSDHIPSLCTLTINVECHGLFTEYTVAGKDLFLIRTADGIVSRAIVDVSTVPYVASMPSAIRITIRNGFGHVVTGRKEWR